MFDIIDNELLFKNRPVARLQPLALGFLRDLEDTIRDFTTADDFEDDHREALKANYDEGFERGKEEGVNDAKNELEDQKTEIENEAFDRGYKQAMLDCANASDASRVNTLLTALDTIHNTLLPLYLGIKVPGSFKRRTPKISEFKSAISGCCSEARVAVNRFREEPTP